MDANRGEYGPPVLRQDLTLKNSVEFLTSDLTLCMSRLLEAGFNLLKDVLSVILVNPEHARSLRGRKTDVKDAEWLAGLAAPRPAATEHHAAAGDSEVAIVEERSREAGARIGAVSGRIQNRMETANIKLGQLATDVWRAANRMARPNAVPLMC